MLGTLQLYCWLQSYDEKLNSTSDGLMGVLPLPSRDNCSDYSRSLGVITSHWNVITVFLPTNILIHR